MIPPIFFKKHTTRYESISSPFYHTLLGSDDLQFRGRPFRIWTTEGTQLVIPPDYVDEVKMLPDNKFPSALRNV